MSETLTCFINLVENVPLWIRALEELENKIKERQDESTRVPVPVSQKMRRTGSNESLRPSQVDAECSAGIEVASAPQLEDAVHAQTSQQTLLTKRKRKTPSLLSTVSTPSKYRSRSNVIVYYDSAVQEAFEQLVRKISTGQNYIRKARMAARMEALTSASAPGIDGEDINIRLPARSARNGTTSGYGPTLARGLASGRGPALRPDLVADEHASNATDACTLANQALDKAQSFCEQGAHQYLRDGDCGVETSGAKKSFREVIKVSEEEIIRLKALEEEEKKRVGEEARLKAQKRQHCGGMDSHPGLLKSNGIHIEADDDEGEEEDDDDDDDSDDDLADLSLPPFRLTART